MVRQAHKALPVQMGKTARQVFQGHKVLPVRQVHKALPVQMA